MADRPTKRPSYFIDLSRLMSCNTYRALPLIERGRVREEIDRRFLSGDMSVFRDFPFIHPTVRRRRISRTIRNRVFSRYGWRCQGCGRTDYLELDHIWPLALGGTDAEANLQPLCQRCNRSKGARA